MNEQNKKKREQNEVKKSIGTDNVKSSKSGYTSQQKRKNQGKPWLLINEPLIMHTWGVS
jgi:hypothetical protein